MTAISLEEAQAKLPEILQHLQPGEEITITEHGEPVAQVKKTGQASLASQSAESRRRPGLGKGMITFIAPDFDAPLEDLKEYME